MNTRPFGRTGLRVSEIGFGAWAIGGDLWGHQDEEVSKAALRRSLDLGIDLVDTAWIYGQGRSETIIGDVLRETGASPFVATKVPPANMCWPVRPGTPIAEVFPATHIRTCTEESLSRLRVDRIDLLQLHVWNEEWTFENEWYDTLMALREEGKIHEFGISVNSFAPDTALEVVRSGRVASVQVVLNIFEQAPLDHLLPAALAAGVAIIARVPFDESSLTGKLAKDSSWPADDFRSRYFGGDRLPKVVERVERLRREAEGDAASLPRLALRWVLSHEAVTSVIPGIRSVEQAEENARASDDGPLPADVLAKLAAHRWDRTADRWP